MISSSVMPVPKRSVREQRPPIERAATSSTHGPASLKRSSACTGPSTSPGAVHGGRQARRRDVERLLEVRAFERVRLVEERQRVQRPAQQQAFQRHLEAGDVLLGEQILGGGA